MRKMLLFSFVIFLSTQLLAQSNAPSNNNAGIEPDASYWETGLGLNINFSQVSFTNWVAGGQNSLSVNALLSAKADYSRGKLRWANALEAGYGTIKQGPLDFFKSDDKFELASKLGYTLTERINASGLVNFKSQFTDGLRSPSDLTLVSSRFAPAYLNVAAGFDFKMAEGLSLMMAPISLKATYLFNDILSTAGGFGLDPGKTSRMEIGGYIRASYEQTILENVNLKTKVDLFSNYLENPQQVDVNWDLLIMMKINKILSASISTQLIYDHDIEIGKDLSGDGVMDDFKPRVQFKELFGIGLTFKF